jgi:hypothetical protein
VSALFNAKSTADTHCFLTHVLFRLSSGVSKTSMKLHSSRIRCRYTELTSRPRRCRAHGFTVPRPVADAGSSIDSSAHVLHQKAVGEARNINGPQNQRNAFLNMAIFRSASEVSRLSSSGLRVEVNSRRARDSHQQYSSCERMVPSLQLYENGITTSLQAHSGTAMRDTVSFIPSPSSLVAALDDLALRMCIRHDI